ncbi:MAG: sodium-translocating pyrophosphatase [Clostridia bacterium]|nr:sodium-translocating pyrophosphatase [Clostridia bacterium]
MHMTTDVWLISGMVLGIISFGIALLIYGWVRKQDDGSERSRKIARAIKDGAWAYLRHLYSALAGVAVVFGVILAIVFSLKGEGFNLLTGLETALAFVVGALCSAIAGFLGMSVAVRANVRTAVAAVNSLNKAFNTAYRAGAVLALAMVGIAVFGMCLIYLVTGNPEVVLGFSFGASSLALLAKAGGGIYTKTADIAADLVGKIEAGIPEDDPRNPAVIADNVGDNVGDVAGMGADIFDSYVAATVAAMLIGFTGFLSSPEETQILYTILPLILCLVGIISSIIGLQLVRVGRNGKPGTALNMATVISCVIFAVLATVLFLVMQWNIGALIATVAGLAIGVIIGFTTGYFTDDNYKPVRKTADIAKSGAALNIISGMSFGFISIGPSLFGIAAATLVSYFSAEAFGLPGVYGVGIAAVGMLSLTGIVVANDAYGPIVDNAKGIAEMSNLGDEVVSRCDVLDSAGNTAKAITKGFAISAAALTVLALFVAYKEQIEHYLPNGQELTLSLLDPLVLAGILLGAMVPPIFSALLMLAVTRNAFTMIEEIRRQFRDIPGILLGTVDPDYATCVGLASQGALKSLILPALLAVLLPLLIGFILGPAALGGFLGGAIFVGIVFALFMANAGGLWDNAKKYVEAGNCGGTGSDAHKATVIGDTVGDPFKDTAGPSINTLITVMTLTSNLFAPLIAVVHLFG